MAKLINGNGNPAIYAAEDADLIASLAGNVTCIANVGNKYAATEEDATTIRLDDGVIITKEGRRIQLEAGESDTFYIPTGTSGQTNYYIIGYKLVQNADSTQVAEQFVQKMNSSTATITEDTFRGGATEVYVSLYRVTQVGFSIDSIDGLLPNFQDNAAIKNALQNLSTQLSIVGGYSGDIGSFPSTPLNGGQSTNIGSFTIPASTKQGIASVQFNLASVNTWVKCTVYTSAGIARSNYLQTRADTFIDPGTAIDIPVLAGQTVTAKVWALNASACDVEWQYLLH